MRPTWQELQAKEQEARDLAALRPYARMLAVHGAGPTGRRCGECVHLFDKARSHMMTPGRYFKCEEFEQGPRLSGPSGDWRKGWAACGRFEAKGETGRE